MWSSVSCRQVSPGGRVPFGVPALSLSSVTAASVLLLHRGGPCWCHSGPQIPGREERTEHDTEMYSGSEPRLYVMVPTRPGTWAKTDPLLKWPSQHRERRCARELQRLQTKHRGLSSHTGVCQPLPDICVLLCQQLLQGAAWPPLLCAKIQGFQVKAPSTGSLRTWLAMCLQCDPRCVD